jgi:glutathione S-transferase
MEVNPVSEQLSSVYHNANQLM